MPNNQVYSIEPTFAPMPFAQHDVVLHHQQQQQDQLQRSSQPSRGLLTSSSLPRDHQITFASSAFTPSFRGGRQSLYPTSTEDIQEFRGGGQSLYPTSTGDIQELHASRLKHLLISSGDNSCQQHPPPIPSSQPPRASSLADDKNREASPPRRQTISSRCDATATGRQSRQNEGKPEVTEGYFFESYRKRKSQSLLKEMTNETIYSGEESFFFQDLTSRLFPDSILFC